MKLLFENCLHKDLSKKSGIYMLICNNHTYIGSSINIYYRLKRHSSDLIRKKHSNKFIQNVFDKHGKDKFLFKIMEFCNKDVLLQRESFYIDMLSPDLNLDLNPMKREFSATSKQLISKSLKEGFKSGVIKNGNSKPVYRYNIEGVFIDGFESCSEAARLLNVKFKGVCKAASGKSNSAYGFIWSYEKKETLIKRVEQNKKVQAINIQGDVINTWVSIKALAKSLSISHSACSIRIKKGKFYKGLKYEFCQVPG